MLCIVLCADAGPASHIMFWIIHTHIRVELLHIIPWILILKDQLRI